MGFSYYRKPEYDGWLIPIPNSYPCTEESLVNLYGYKKAITYAESLYTGDRFAQFCEINGIDIDKNWEDADDAISVIVETIKRKAKWKSMSDQYENYSNDRPYGQVKKEVPTQTPPKEPEQGIQIRNYTSTDSEVTMKIVSATVKETQPGVYEIF